VTCQMKRNRRKRRATLLNNYYCKELSKQV
jgi:hypothetical protein